MGDHIYQAALLNRSNGSLERDASLFYQKLILLSIPVKQGHELIIIQCVHYVNTSKDLSLLASSPKLRLPLTPRIGRDRNLPWSWTFLKTMPDRMPPIMKSLKNLQKVMVLKHAREPQRLYDIFVKQAGGYFAEQKSDEA
jgi:hypothetical protein